MASSRPETFYKNRPTNLVPGEPPPAGKRVDADKLLENFDSVFRALGLVKAQGNDAVNGNDNGLSTATQCNLTLKNDQGNDGIIDVGDWVYITDGVNVWGKSTGDAPAVSDNDEVSFCDDNLLSGEGPDDYSSPAFINSLVLLVSKFPIFVGKSQLNLRHDSLSGLTAEDIALSSSDETKIAGFASSLKERVDSVIEAGGGLKGDVISSTAIDPNGFKYTGTKNLVMGGFHQDGNRDGVADGVEKLNGGSGEYELDTAVKKIGVSSQKVTSSTAGVGIKFNIADYEMLRGQKISVAAWIRVTSQSARIKVYDGVSTYSSAEIGSPGSWVRGTFTCTVDGSASELSVRLESTAADTQYYDGVMVSAGEMPWAYVENDEEKMAEDSMLSSPLNLLPNPAFDDFSRGDDAMPDGWMSRGNPPDSIAQVDAERYFSRYSCLLELENSQGIQHLLAEEAQQLTVDKDWVLSCWMKRYSAPGTDDTIRIGTMGDGAVYETVCPADFDDWTLVVVRGTGEITGVYIENIGGSDFSKFYMDGLQFYLGDKATQGRLADGFGYQPVMFSATMVSSDTYLNGPGGFAGDGFPLGKRGYIWRLTACGDAGLGAEGKVTARKNGINTALEVSLDETLVFNQDAIGQLSEVVFFNIEDLISVYFSHQDGAFSSLRATVTFLYYI